MKLVETKCANCGSSIHVYEDYLRDEMYCTLNCMKSDSEMVMVKESSGFASVNLA
ncbi:hypothetical protein V7O66_01585 [Methanolobus sp. ZRKC3]|uniref:hypothetical protein n=1 Tax=Methanolobus sp. ZRKC3 TaxID=3125786 RepID=UPI003245A13A